MKSTRFRFIGKLLGLVSMITVLLLTSTVQAKQSDTPADTRYLDQLQVKREENWIQRQIRQFRTYPHLDRAYRSLEGGRLLEARTELEKYLAIDPEDLQVRVTYLILLQQLKAYGEVIGQADIILERQPGFTPALFYRGLAKQVLNQLDGVMMDFQLMANNADVEEDDRLFALNMVADLAIKQRSYADAIAALEKLAKIREDFNLYFRQGIALEGLNRLTEAGAAYKLALSLASDPKEHLRALLALGELAKKRQDWESAQQTFLTAFDLNPRDPELMRTLAEIAYALKNYAEAARWMRQALAIQANVRDQEFLANALYAAKDYKAAAKEFTQLLSNLDNAEGRFRVYMALGYMYTELQQPDQAVAAFQEAVKINKDPSALTALAQALENQGKPGNAIKPLEEALTHQPTAETHLKLSLLYAKVGEDRKALQHLEQAIQDNLPLELKQTAYRQQGYLYQKQRRYLEARQAFEKALALNSKDAALYAALGQVCLELGALREAISYFERSLAWRETAEGLGSLASAYVRAEQWQKAVQTYRRLLNMRGLSATQKGEILANLGFIYIHLGQDQQAVNAFRQAIAMGRDDAAIRSNLGVLLVRENKWQEAIEQFRLALKQREEVVPLLYIGRSYKELQKPGLAISYLNQVLLHKDQLTESEQRQLYSELGYLYAEEAEYQRAADAWKQSLSLQYDPAIALRLGRMQRLLGRVTEARQTLDGISINTLPSQLQPEFFDESAQLYAKDQELEKAIDAQIQANRIEPSTEREYRLGLYYQDLGDLSNAIPHYEAAVAREPQNPEYAAALGYAYSNTGRHTEAARLLETALERDPDNLNLYKDLGYVHMRNADNEQAVNAFKHVIDNKSFYPIRSQQEQEKLDLDIYQIRKEVSKITNRFDFTVYESYRSNTGHFTTAPVGSGVIPSQGGMELAYQPSVIGFRDERTLQFFSRLLWTNKPKSLNLESDSLQGGIGVRYKPLKTQNLYLSFEKLLKIGSNSDDNWLLRGLWGWSDGTELKPNKSLWNYTLLYGDLGYFVKEPGTWAFYGEARQGLTYKLAGQLLFSPHLVLDGRHQDPDPSDVSYLEAGAGVSLRYLFNETRYEAYRSDGELLIQYKAGLENTGNGWVITGIVRF